MKESFANETVATFCDKLAGGDSTPGGGAAAALAGAQGIALGSMCANLTLGRAKYADWAEGAQAAVDKAAPIMQRMLDGMDADAAAFDAFMDALSLPKATDEEKAARTAALQNATKIATEVPLALLADCEAALTVVEGLAGKSNPTCASDIGAAALQIKAAAQMAELNVRINLKVLKDPAQHAAFSEECAARLARILPGCDKVHAEILGLYQ
ncbi:MAG: cyclodeaminase/cyclohydrolase family protein [Clostridiales bacterium]|nr:cyclodeaminase/cyclohydrolase family protein [Clostridiales bacterium]